MLSDVGATSFTGRLIRVGVLAGVLLAGLLAGVGGGAAVAQSPAKSVTKCVNPKTGVARVIKPAGRCRPGERKVTATLGAPAAAPSKVACADGGVCKVGDTGPGGGMVFLLPSSKGNRTGKYFEVAPRTWNGVPNDPFYPDPAVAWCNRTDAEIPGARGTRIGTGAANTRDMIAACGSGAANLVQAYTGGGKTDWFLPSKDELDALAVRNIAGFYPDYYWSSSQYYGWITVQHYGSDTAWIAGFDEGDLYAESKDVTGCVRPVRAFSP